MRSTNRGFTVVELLITLIGLTGMGMVGYFMYLLFKLMAKYAA